MNIQRVVSHRGVTVDLETVKCFHKVSERMHVLVIEFISANVKYVLNPDTQKHELHIFNNKLEIECRNFTVAEQYLEEWTEIWQNYLSERDEEIESFGIVDEPDIEE